MHQNIKTSQGQFGICGQSSTWEVWNWVIWELPLVKCLKIFHLLWMQIQNFGDYIAVAAFSF